MGRKVPGKPTNSELAILNVLWSRGTATVREVFDELNQTRPTGYTTVLKLLQIMTEKGLVIRDDSERSHRYQAARPEEQTQKQLVADLMERAFGGSAARLVLHALSSKRASSAELDQIRKFIDEMERRRP